MSSIEKRLALFLKNERISVQNIWGTFLLHLFSSFKKESLECVLDLTPHGKHFTVVYLGVLLHTRVLPICWAVMPARDPWDERQWVIVERFLQDIAPHVKDTHSTLIADRGLTGASLIFLCQQYGWSSLLRLSLQHTFQRRKGEKWMYSQSFASFSQRKRKQWYGEILLWQKKNSADVPELFLERRNERAIYCRIGQRIWKSNDQ